MTEVKTLPMQSNPGGRHHQVHEYARRVRTRCGLGTVRLEIYTTSTTAWIGAARVAQASKIFAAGVEW
jgi:hypothetical protein